MEKNAAAKPLTRTLARYSRVRQHASSEGKPALPARIKVLEVQVPMGNPYDIGIEETLLALRRSGVLTKSGKLGKIFR